MITTKIITYDYFSKVYKIDDGSWVNAWDYINNTKINEFGFDIVDNTMKIMSDYLLQSITPIEYPYPYDIQMNVNDALFIDTENNAFNEERLFTFEFTFFEPDENSVCENIYGDLIDTFEFSTDGVIYGTNSGDETISSASINANCCSALGYFFNPDNAKCYWSVPCEIDDYIKVIINPEGNDGVIFDVTDGENCYLDISFDWLLEYDCEKLLSCAGNNSILNILSGVTLTMNLERMVQSQIGKSNGFKRLAAPNTINESVYSEILFNGGDILNYFSETDSGIILIGKDCDVVIDNVEEELLPIFSGFTSQNLYSDWKHFRISITDPTILALINNEKIKLSLVIEDSACDMSILVDNIQLNKMCEFVETEETFVIQCPSFELDRIVDNKKSWVAETELVGREFELKKRETDYYINHHKLGINSKEVELNISPSRAIETDVMNEVLNNPCLLTPLTNNNIIVDLQDNLININNNGYFTNEGNDFTNNSFGFMTDDILLIYSKFPIVSARVTSPAGDWEVQIFDNPHEIGFAFDFLVSETWYIEIITNISEGNLNGLITTPLNENVFTLENFVEILTTELIDVKDRQTIGDYPVLRMLYERYLNSFEVCGFYTNAFNYADIDNFIDLIGNYWVELVEQVVPSTTIWGSTYKYSNTLFDNNKFKYRKSSLFTCQEPTIKPIIGSVSDTKSGIEVIKTIITVDENGKQITTVENCEGVYVVQIDDGSEFIGSVSILGINTGSNIDSSDVMILNESMNDSVQN